MCETDNPNGEPWTLYCETCGWIILGISWETVLINVSAALKRIKETKADITRGGQKHHGHVLIVRTLGSLDQD